MPINFEPSTPEDAYKSIIDQLVEETTPGVSERHVQETGMYSNAPAENAANELVQLLNLKQRTIVAKMLRQERISAIGGTLAVLTWWLRCRNVALTFEGNPMPFELSGEGLHGDYIGRSNGWEWPKQSANE